MPDFKALFWPRSIALVGASPDKHGIRGRIVDAVRQHGFAGPIYPISRSHEVIDGLRTYSSPEALPEAVDLAIVTIPAVYVADALAACGARGVRAAVIISSGFAEEQGEHGAAREAAIRDVVARYDLAVLGPNSEGFLNTAIPLTATFSPTVFEHPDGLVPAQASPGGVAVVSQSGGIGFSFFDRGHPKALRFSTVVSMGNEAGLEGLDVCDYLLDDAQTDVVLGFVEGFRTPHKFARVAARAAELRKPLVLAKVGGSEAGARAASSHTATLAGSQRAYDAMFTRYGVIPGTDTDSMLDIATGFAFFRNRLPRGRRVAILTPSGGAGIWLADVCQAHGLDVPPLDAPTREAIDRLLPAYGTSLNPVDVTAQVIFKLGYAPVLEILAASPSIDAILVAGSQGIQKYVAPQTDALTALAKRIDMPVIFCTYARAHPRVVAMLAGCGFPCLTNMPNAARTLVAMAEYARFLDRFAADNGRRDVPYVIPPPVAQKLAGPERVLCEHEAKAVLAELGVAEFADTLATDAAAAVAAAAALQQPVALKVQSPDIPHRNQVGGVALAVAGDTAVREAFGAILKAARAQRPHADIHGVLVSPMAANGVELIVGITRDADFGPMLVLGAGGTFVEVLDDVIVTPAPVTRAQLRELIAAWKGHRLLDGCAGLPVADVDALIELAVNVSRFAAAADRLASLDLNPVVVHPLGNGVSIVDALIITRAATGKGTTSDESVQPTTEATP